MIDNQPDEPVFGTGQPGSAAAAHDDLPPEPDGVKPMSSSRMRVPMLRGEGLLTQTPVVEDPRLCNALMALLSTLENDRARLEQRSGGNAPAEVLEIAAEMVEVVTTLAERYLGTADAGLSAALTEAKKYRESLAVLREEFSESAVRAVVVFLRRSGLSRTDRRTAYRTLVERLPGVLEPFFVLFEDRFKWLASAMEWNVTYPLFLEDLDKLVRVLECP
jgi:hypothetical protein